MKYFQGQFQKLQILRPKISNQKINDRKSATPYFKGMKIATFNGNLAEKDKQIEDHCVEFQQSVNQFPDLKAKYFSAVPYFLHISND